MAYYDPEKGQAQEPMIVGAPVGQEPLQGYAINQPGMMQPGMMQPQPGMM